MFTVTWTDGAVNGRLGPDRRDLLVPSGSLERAESPDEDLTTNVRARGYEAGGAILIPDTDLARVKRWAKARNDDLPARAQGLIRYELDVTDRTITILECRPPWNAEYGPEWTRFPIARVRYTGARKE